MDLNTPEGKLAYDLKCTEVEKMHYNELREAVAVYKNSETGERKMSSVWKEVEDEGKAKGIAEGIEKGIVQGKLERSSEVARNLLLKNKMSKEEIAEVTNLSLDEVSRIKSQMKMC